MKSIGGWRLAAVGAILLSLPIAAACGQASATDESDVVGDDFEIQFKSMYSAYDGEHTFQVPAVLNGFKKGVKWSAKPADLVDLEDGKDGTVMITTKKPGKVDIIARVGNLSSKSTLEILEATPDDWEQGSDRYNNGIVWKRGEGRSDGGGGGGGGWDGGKRERTPPDPMLACAGCHGEQAKRDESDSVKHTPMQTAGYSDDDLIDIFTNGVKPEGVKYRIMKKERWNKLHQWDMTDEQKKGMIVYLRSLTPEEQGETDFGGRGKWGGKKRDDGDGDRDRTPSDGGTDPS